MVVITDAKVHTIPVGNRELFWIKMIDVQYGLGIKNISNLVRKNIQGRYETKILQKSKSENTKGMKKNYIQSVIAIVDLLVVIIWKK